MDNQITLHKQPNITVCYHCGDDCKNKEIIVQDKVFCCNGCKTVYELLHHNELDNYYCLTEAPGKNFNKKTSKDFLLLDDISIAQQFITFSDKSITQVSFYLPQIHCSSCLWLLENLKQLDENIIFSQVNFSAKKINISFNNEQLTVRKVAELLSAVGYEPYLTLSQEEGEKSNGLKKAYLKLGVVGFCFANIMLISFPEYLGLEMGHEKRLTLFFRYMNVILALPVFFYGAREFFVNAFNSFKQKYLNIDAPIALAVLVTFLRSLYEIFTNTGGGFLDSMSGIVLFMLIGRTLQNRTFASINFTRNYTAYFPIAVTTVQNGQKVSKKIKEIAKDDIIALHHQEIIPTDGIITKGNSSVDYSFVTGENAPSPIAIGNMVYAGGKILGSGIEIMALKPFEQNSFIQLWNNDVFKDKKDPASHIHKIGKYFAIIVLVIAAIGFVFWYPKDITTAWNAATAILIIACPCALLLTSSFTNGYAINLFSKHGFFVKNAQTIENLSKINHIVFDKTGTITQANRSNVTYAGKEIPPQQYQVIFNLFSQSIHPLSKSIAGSMAFFPIPVKNYKEITGQGIEAYHDDVYYKLGKYAFVTGDASQSTSKSEVCVSIDKVYYGKFTVENEVKAGMPPMLKQLQGYRLSLLSGDNNISHQQMQAVFPEGSQLVYEQSPQDKLDYIKNLQKDDTNNVLMLGDGLNDAGALQQSNVGISIVDDSFSFAAASQGILHGNKLHLLPAFLKSAKNIQTVIRYCFIYSLLYNIIGIYFSLTGQLSPMIAAILMPSSSLSIIAIAYFSIKYIDDKNMTNIRY